MAQAVPLPSIPLATGGPITDDILEKVERASRSAQQNECLTDAALILLTIPQIAAELLHRRRAMGVIADMADLENVTFLNSARDYG